MAQQGDARLRPRRRARAGAAAPRRAAEAAALTRLLLAIPIALLGTALGYALLGAVLAVSAGWSRAVVIDQALGLGIHAVVVFVRGVLPTVLATGVACLLWRRWRGREPGTLATLALALAAAALVTALVLTSQIAGLPRLEIERAADAAATVALLAAVGAGAHLLARRLLRRRARLHVPLTRREASS